MAISISHQLEEQLLEGVGSNCGKVATRLSTSMQGGATQC